MNSKPLPGMEDNFVSWVAGERPTVNRSWANPDDHNFVIGIDYGKQGLAASVYDVAAKTILEPIVKRDFTAGLLWLPKQYQSALIVGEQAHFAVPQNETNLAQPFTAEILKTFYKLCSKNNSRFMLFPQLMTTALKSWAETNRKIIADLHKAELPTKKGDVNDAIILMWFLIRENSISLALPYKDFGMSSVQEFSNNVRVKSNFILNCASKDARIYDGDGGYYHEFARRSEDLWLDCGFKNKKWIKYCFSVLTLMFDDPGRTGSMEPHHYNEKFLRWKDFSQHVLRNTPFHFRGGRARSNIWRHFWRSFIHEKFKKKKKENEFFKRAFKDDKPNSLRPFEEMLPDHKQYLRELKKDFRLILKKMYNNAKRKWPC